MNLINFTYLNLISFIYGLTVCMLIIFVLLIRSQLKLKQRNQQLKKINRNYISLNIQLRRLSNKVKINKKLNKKKEPLAKNYQTQSLSATEKLKSLSKELNQWKQRVPPLIDRYKNLSLKYKNLKNELLEAKRIIALSEVMNTADKTKTVINLNNYRSRDNLQMIRGIGPSIEKTLNQFDIFRLNQIVSMTDLEIETIANKIKGLKSQIYREDWIGQAEILLQKNHLEKKTK